MPTRVNGIGTAYLGKKNREEYHGACEFCSQSTAMCSYDTRLWFTVLFVPLIPLRRKRILDYCPLCTRHRAVNIDEWERITREAIDAGAEVLAQKHDDPEAAINMHGTLVSCGRRAEAEKLAGIMQSRFPDHFDTHLYLGVWYASIGKTPQDDVCFARALEIDPENLAARRAVGVAKIEQGKLDEARELFAPLEPPSVHYDPQLFFLLGAAHQQRGEHAQAMELFRLVADASPDVTRQKEFRKAVRQTEMALGSESSLVPSIPFYSHKGVRWAALVLAAVIAYGGYAWYLGQNRVLHVVNGLSLPITVQIDGDEIVDVAGQGVTTTRIAEGNHRAVVSVPEGLDEPVEFSLSTGLLGRPFKKPVFVIDPSRTAFVIRDEVLYSETPQPDEHDNIEFHIGEGFNFFPDIDYVFEEFPEQIKIERGREIVKTRVTHIGASPPSALFFFPNALAGNDKLDYLERHLDFTGNDKPLLTEYHDAAQELDQMDRCHEFLAAGLEVRPIAVEWHRAYLNVCDTHGRYQDLPARYDALLAEEPENSAVWYLRALVELDGRKAAEMIARSLELNENNADAWMVRADLAAEQGDFAAARKAAARALSIKPDNDDIRHQLFRIRQANGELQELEQELTQLVTEEPLDVRARMALISVLIAADKREDAERAQQELAELAGGLLPDDPHQLALHTELVYLYLKQDFERLAERFELARNQSTAALLGLEALVMTGRMDDVSAVIERLDRGKQGYGELLLSAAWTLKGDEQQAAQHEQRAIERLSQGSFAERWTAGFLQQESVSADDVDRLHLSPTRKSCLLAFLLTHERGEPGKLIERAEALAAMRTFPYHAVRQAVDRVRGQSSGDPAGEPPEAATP